MFNYLISAIKRFLGFSKVDAQGTLVLMFIMLAAFIGSRLYVNHLKSKAYINDSEELEEWVASVEASFDVRPEPQPTDKKDYLPVGRKLSGSSVEAKSSIKTKEPIKVLAKDLNTASATDLQMVKGIGKVYSERIINYRNLLGGFSSTSQLHEVYGLNAETIEQLDKIFEVQSPVKPIEINADSARVLAQHPYISYDLAWIIINYRKQHGDIKSSEDLRKIKAIDEHTISRLKPYLK